MSGRGKGMAPSPVDRRPLISRNFNTSALRALRGKGEAGIRLVENTRPSTDLSPPPGDTL